VPARCQGIELGIEDTVGEDVAHATSLHEVLAVCRHAAGPLRERERHRQPQYTKRMALAHRRHIADKTQGDGKFPVGRSAMLLPTSKVEAGLVERRLL